MTVQASPAARTGGARPTARFGAVSVWPAMDDLGRLAPLQPTRPYRKGARAEELIHLHAMTARAACTQMTAGALKDLHDSVKRASCLPTRPRWARKADAHAELFRLLANVAGSPPASRHGGQARSIRDLIRTVGPTANGMITSSHQRLLAHLRAGDAESAALEMETHLRALHYMRRLVAPHARLSW